MYNSGNHSLLPSISSWLFYIYPIKNAIVSIQSPFPYFPLRIQQFAHLNFLLLVEQFNCFLFLSGLQSTSNKSTTSFNSAFSNFLQPNTKLYNFPQFYIWNILCNFRAHYFAPPFCLSFNRQIVHSPKNQLLNELLGVIYMFDLCRLNENMFQLFGYWF